MRQGCAFIAAGVICVLGAAPSYSQLTENRTPDPQKAQFVVQEILNFVDAYRALESGVDTFTRARHVRREV